MIEGSIDVLLLEIYEYLLNHEIMNVMCTSKSMYRKIPFYEILDFMNYRVHPLVINKFDQYCKRSNEKQERRQLKNDSQHILYTRFFTEKPTFRKNRNISIRIVENEETYLRAYRRWKSAQALRTIEES